MYNMFRIVFLVTLLSIVCAQTVQHYNFHNDKYTVNFRYARLHYYNLNYARNVHFKTFKYNRTIAAVNATFSGLRNLNHNLTVNFDGYLMASNEYRKPVFQYEVNFCNALSYGDYGFKRLLECGNFDGCPLTKGSVKICNFTPDGSKFPPNLPEGQYGVTVTLKNGNVGVAVLIIEFIVAYPVMYE